MVDTARREQARLLSQFTIDYFAALGGKLSQEGGLLRVELTPDQLAELEGRTGPRMGLFGLEEPECTVLYLAFDRVMAEKHPSSELVAPGSHRLRQMAASVGRQGRVARLALVRSEASSPGSELHQPYLLFHFRVSLLGKTHRQELAEACVDLTDGSLHPEVAERAQTSLLLDAVPSNVRQRRIGFLQAWHIACAHVRQTLSGQDDGWAREALLAMAQERHRLEHFYRETETGDELDREKRLTELKRRSGPRAIARTCLSAALFVPLD